MLKTRIKTIALCLSITALVAGCSDEGPDDESGATIGSTTGPNGDTDADVFVPPLADGPPSPVAPESDSNIGVLFPLLQGRWTAGCQLFDEEEPSEGYERSVLIVTGNEFVLDTSVFFDSNCVTPLPRGFLQNGDNFQSYGNLVRPGGTANSSVGAVPFIDFNLTRFTIDDEPLVPSVAAFFGPYIDYTIVYVDGDQMFLGQFDIPGQDGETPQTRALTLDFANPLTRF